MYYVYMPSFKDCGSIDGGLEHLKRVSLTRSLPSLHLYYYLPFCPDENFGTCTFRKDDDDEGYNLAGEFWVNSIMMLIRRQKLQQRKMASGWVGEREGKIAM